MKVLSIYLVVGSLISNIAFAGTTPAMSAEEALISRGLALEGAGLSNAEYTTELNEALTTYTSTTSGSGLSIERIKTALVRQRIMTAAEFDDVLAQAKAETTSLDPSTATKEQVAEAAVNIMAKVMTFKQTGSTSGNESMAILLGLAWIVTSLTLTIVGLATGTPVVTSVGAFGLGSLGHTIRCANAKKSPGFLCFSVNY